MSEEVEIITPDGRYVIPSTDLESYRAGDAPDGDASEVEGFAFNPSNFQPQQQFNLTLGTTPVIRTNSFIAFSAETVVTTH